MVDIILYAGLPGSGKTYHANKCCDVVIDDITDISQLPDVEVLRTKVLGITDANFCDNKILQKAITKLLQKYANASIEVRYFENDADKCRANVARRNDGRNVEGTIRRFEKIYDPSSNIAMKIFVDII